MRQLKSCFVKFRLDFGLHKCMLHSVGDPITKFNTFFAETKSADRIGNTSDSVMATTVQRPSEEIREKERTSWRDVCPASLQELNPSLASMNVMIEATSRDDPIIDAQTIRQLVWWCIEYGRHDPSISRVSAAGSCELLREIECGYLKSSFCQGDDFASAPCPSDEQMLAVCEGRLDDSILPRPEVG